MKLIVQKNTDQLNYEDFLGGAQRIVTIKGVEKGRKEAQYDIAIEEDARFWRPPATILKLLVLAYGDETDNWVGKRANLFGDPDVKMKGVKVGGIRVSHLSHLDKPLVESLTVTRGQSAVFTIQPLPDSVAPKQAAPHPDAAQILELRGEWATADPERRAAIEAQVAELQASA